MSLLQQFVKRADTYTYVTGVEGLLCERVETWNTQSCASVCLQCWRVCVLTCVYWHVHLCVCSVGVCVYWHVCIDMCICVSAVLTCVCWHVCIDMCICVSAVLTCASVCLQCWHVYVSAVLTCRLQKMETQWAGVEDVVALIDATLQGLSSVLSKGSFKKVGTGGRRGALEWTSVQKE